MKPTRFFDLTTTKLFAILIIIDLAMIFLGVGETLDKKIYYSGVEANALLNAFSEERKNKYFYNQILDLLLITTYSAIFYVNFKKVIQSKSIALLSLVPGLFDLIETSAIILILKNPNYVSILEWLGCITFLKWTTGFVVFFALIFLFRKKTS